MHFYVKNCIRPTAPFTSCGSNEILDSDFSSENKKKKKKEEVILCALGPMCQTV